MLIVQLFTILTAAKLEETDFGSAMTLVIRETFPFIEFVNELGALLLEIFKDSRDSHQSGMI